MPNFPLETLHVYFSHSHSTPLLCFQRANQLRASGATVQNNEEFAKIWAVLQNMQQRQSESSPLLTSHFFSFPRPCVAWLPYMRMISPMCPLSLPNDPGCIVTHWGRLHAPIHILFAFDLLFPSPSLRCTLPFYVHTALLLRALFWARQSVNKGCRGALEGAQPTNPALARMRASRAVDRQYVLVICHEYRHERRPIFRTMAFNWVGQCSLLSACTRLR